MYEDMFGRSYLPPKETETMEANRETQLEYCRDYFEDFIEFVEEYEPEIVREFWNKFPRKRQEWLNDGVVIKMGGK